MTKKAHRRLVRRRRIIQKDNTRREVRAYDEKGRRIPHVWIEK